MWDVIIVGGGPAGLSAALMLGRSCRRVLVLDDLRYRNARARRTHGFFTRDGAPPDELRRIGREQLARYGVDYRHDSVLRAERLEHGFLLQLRDEDDVRCRHLLLATGLEDVLPPIPGVEAFYGKSVHHCPYCDGWEVRGTAFAAYAQGTGTVEFALGLLSWSDDVILFTDGSRRLSSDDQWRLRCCGVRWIPERITALEGTDGQLERIHLDTGVHVPRQALFFQTRPVPRSPLAEELGCHFTKRGTVKTGRLQQTSVPGLWVIGDAARDVQWVVVAASEGAKAAYAINRSLREEDCDRRIREYGACLETPSATTQ